MLPSCHVPKLENEILTDACSSVTHSDVSWVCNLLSLSSQKSSHIALCQSCLVPRHLQIVAIIISHPQFYFVILSLSKFWWHLSITSSAPTIAWQSTTSYPLALISDPASSAVLPPTHFRVQLHPPSTFHKYSSTSVTSLMPLFWSLSHPLIFSPSLSCIFSHIFTLHISSLWSLSLKITRFPWWLEG